VRAGSAATRASSCPPRTCRTWSLRDEVLAAVEEGSFRVYPVATIDQGLELLSGLPAGAPDAGGAFPPESFNGRVATRLAEAAAAARAFAAGGERERQGSR
jgi:hypothetical protein